MHVGETVANIGEVVTRVTVVHVNGSRRPYRFGGKVGNVSFLWKPLGNFLSSAILLINVTFLLFILVKLRSWGLWRCGQRSSIVQCACGQSMVHEVRSIEGHLERRSRDSALPFLFPSRHPSSMLHG
jgi:hypothetical protein